jgi:hypothetical protein
MSVGEKRMDSMAVTQFREPYSTLEGRPGALWSRRAAVLPIRGVAPAAFGTQSRPPSTPCGQWLSHTKFRAR